MKLVSGLGGGLDIINASLVYYALKGYGMDVRLGSSRPAPLSCIENHAPFEDCGTMINKDSKINYGRENPRYPEPKISGLLEEDVIFFSRRYEGQTDVKRLRKAIDAAEHIFDFREMFFIDGGGDSLILTPEDAAGTAESKNPFEGGDAAVLEALAGKDLAYLGVISVGLDVSVDGFKRNIERLDKIDAYLGRINLITMEKQDYRLDSSLDFKKGFLKPYSALAENILVLDEEDLNNPDKTPSHTATVTYHALKGNYGTQRTFVPWEPTKAGEKGVIVSPIHAWMYFFDAGKIHDLKVELNR